MVPEFLQTGIAKTDRERFFEQFDDSDAAFPHLIYLDTSGQAKNSSRQDFITIVYALEWPKEKGVPIPYQHIEAKKPADRVVAVLFRTTDFLQRHLGVEVKLYDVRSGCVRVRFVFSPDTDLDRLRNALNLLKGNASAYDITSISARFQGRSVGISNQ